MHDKFRLEACCCCCCLPQVCSRYVWLLAGLICLVGGVIGKLGALLALVPDPVVGGILAASMAMIFSSAVNMLTHVEMTSSRNQIVLGLSFTLGVSTPIYTNTYRDDIDTGKFANRV